jgi:drug/metabolite transporter (DMT)-like permease
MVMCAALSFAVRASGLVPRQNLKSRRHLTKVAALAVVFVASVVGGNISLRFIPVSFNQAIGATTPFFTALLSLCIMRQKESSEVYVTLVPIVLGIVLASRAEPLFHFAGFVACFSATFSRALKSVLQGLLLTNESERLDSLNLLLFMSPVALLVLLTATQVMEPDAFAAFLENCAESPSFFFILATNCLLAFSVNLTNFLVTKCTSPLTLQVLGNAKGAVAVVVSIFLFRNPVSPVGMFGYSITIMGVVAYSEAKKRSKEKLRRREDLEMLSNRNEGKGAVGNGAA